MKISGEDGNGWWLPNQLNSTISDPIFYRRGEVPIVPLVKLERCQIPADGKMEVSLDCHEVIQAAMSQAKRESPGQSPGYYRIGIPVTVNAPGGVDRYLIISEWISLKEPATPKPR